MKDPSNKASGRAQIALLTSTLLLITVSLCGEESQPDLAKKIADLMRQHPSGQAGQRFELLISNRGHQPRHRL